jgi:toxin ParE1/3/4
VSQYKLARAALADLRDIEAYTYDNWGAEQRNLYVRALAATFQRLAENPDAGRLRPDIRDGLRSYVCRQHVVFYRVSESAVEILRVLHHSRDVRGAF